MTTHHIPPDLPLTQAQLDYIADRAARILATRLPVAPVRPSPYMSIVEAADYLRTSRQRIDDLLSMGRLTRIKDGARTLIARTEIEAYLRHQTPRGGPTTRAA